MAVGDTTFVLPHVSSGGPSDCFSPVLLPWPRWFPCMCARASTRPAACPAPHTGLPKRTPFLVLQITGTLGSGFVSLRDNRPELPAVCAQKPFQCLLA